jgi:titin
MSAVATSSSSVSLSWNASARASTYEWYWTTSSSFTPNNSTAADVSGLTGTTDTHGGRTPATTYYYWVRARNSIGTSGWSNRDSAITFAVAPATPTGLSVSAGGTATWIGSSGATSYTLQWQRATNSSGASPTATTTVSGLTGTSYSIPSVSGKIWARARVRASNAVGDSAYTAYTAWS